MYDASCEPGMYQAQGKQHAFPDLTNKICPQCHADYLRRHGYYSRDLVTEGFEGIILIRRYLCKECGRTVSVLPAFCHPRRTYGMRAIIGLLKEYYVKIKAVCQAVLSYYKTSGVEISRQLLRHYRIRLKKNLNNLIMAITDIRSLRAPPVTESKDKKEKARQLLSLIQHPLEDALKIHERTGTSYLTPQAN